MKFVVMTKSLYQKTLNSVEGSIPWPLQLTYLLVLSFVSVTAFQWMGEDSLANGSLLALEQSFLRPICCRLEYVESPSFYVYVRMRESVDLNVSWVPASKARLKASVRHT